jgi:hypothetical protein
MVRIIASREVGVVCVRCEAIYGEIETAMGIPRRLDATATELAAEG